MDQKPLTHQSDARSNLNEIVPVLQSSAKCKPFLENYRHNRHSRFPCAQKNPGRPEILPGQKGKAAQGT
jgi:hypothetical protein